MGRVVDGRLPDGRRLRAEAYTNTGIAPVTSPAHADKEHASPSTRQRHGSQGARARPRRALIDDGDVAVLRMQDGKVQALDLELVEALAATLDELAAADPAAVVLTGSGSSFSAGVDLFRVVEGGRDYIEPFLVGLDRCLRGLFTFPRPVVAAINGHAIAGGMVLACACDERLLARGNARLAIPELLVGVAFPAAALRGGRTTFLTRLHHVHVTRSA